jgi:hypothetical protein
MRRAIASLTLAFVLVPTTASAHHRKYEAEPLSLEAEGFCDNAFSGQGYTRLGGLAKMGLEDVEGDFRALALKRRLSRRLTHTTTPWEVFDTQVDTTDGDVLPSAYGPEGGHADYRWKLELIARWIKDYLPRRVIKHHVILVKLDWRGVCPRRELS